MEVCCKPQEQFFPQNWQNSEKKAPRTALPSPRPGFSHHSVVVRPGPPLQGCPPVSAGSPNAPDACPVQSGRSPSPTLPCPPGLTPIHINVSHCPGTADHSIHMPSGCLDALRARAGHSPGHWGEPGQVGLYPGGPCWAGAPAAGLPWALLHLRGLCGPPLLCVRLRGGGRGASVPEFLEGLGVQLARRLTCSTGCRLLGSRSDLQGSPRWGQLVIQVTHGLLQTR